jgi:hypothetical protein
MNRSESITALRSEIQTDQERSPLPLEQFQNDTLRPILKFQNDIYVAFVKSYLENMEVPGKKHAMQEFLKLRFQKDVALRNSVLGLTMALFTSEEMEFYLPQKSELNKRIVAMLAQRLAEQLVG